MAVSIYLGVNVSISDVGNDTIKVKTINGVTSKETIVNGGLANQQNNYLLSGKVTRGKETKIASIEITTANGSCFKSRPIINTDFPENIRIKSIISERESFPRFSKPKTYVIHLFYVNSTQIFSGKNLTCEIQYKKSFYTPERKALYSSTPTINRITFKYIFIFYV